MKLSAHERENTGPVTPSHALRIGINGHIRSTPRPRRRHAQPRLQAERLVYHGHASAEKAVAVNYSPDEVVAFRLGDGRMLEFGKSDPQLRHLGHAWASTVHPFQGRTVDKVIAVMEAKPPKLSTQKSFYVEISRPRATESNWSRTMRRRSTRP